MPDASRPGALLLLAPHFEYPARNGADITHDELGRALSRHLPYVTLAGMRDVLRLEGGEVVRHTTFTGGMRPRLAAAARTVLFRSHYYKERFNTPAFARVAHEHLADPGYGSVLHSYLTTAALAPLPEPSRRHLVWTHNDEFAWFEDFARQNRNPVARLTARNSIRWIERFWAGHRSDLTLVHVTEADREGWARRLGPHRSAVVPIGVTLRGAAAPPRPAGAPLRLLFVGALGVRMNLDALTHFAERFFPALRARFGDGLLVDVVGSKPLPEVADLCARHGWRLHPDAPDETLDALFADATFSLLPFAYATGAKLKLLKSLAYGVPFLGTEAVEAQRSLATPPNLLSDDPSAWADHAARVQAEGIGAAARTRLRALAEAHSWDASAARFLAALAPDAP
ncbi:MAG TPA: glycosyltransferase [Rhodothermales bacterium]|nr:glycosyltransferase [Rhodothermales bacterium]